MTALVAAVILLIEAACAIAIGARVTSWVCDEKPDDALLRCVVGLIAGLAAVLAILQVCGMVDLLRRGDVLVAHLLAAAAVVRFVPKGAPPDRAWWRLPPTIVGALGAFFAIFGLALGVRGGPSTEPDTVQYHAPNAGFWLQVHNLWKLPVAVPGYFTNVYPSNGELLGLWVMLPSHSDQLAYAVNVVFGILAVLSAALLARELGGPAWSGALAGLAVVLTPVSFQTQTHSLMTDLAGASGIIASAALVVVAVRSSHRVRWAVLAGVALGIGVGSKDSALLPGIGVLVLLVCLVPRAARIRSGLGLILGVVSLAGVWWVRAAAATGNPIFPAGVGSILPKGISPLNPYSTTLVGHMVAGRLGPLHRLEGDARTLIGPALVLVALGVAVPIVVGVTRRQWPLFLVGGLAAASLLAYAMTPYTGGGTGGLNFLIASQLRYALPGMLLAAAALAAIWPQLSAAVAAVAVVWDVAKDFRAPGFRTDIHPSIAIVALAAVLTMVLFGVSRVPPRVLAGAGAVVALVGLTFAYHRGVSGRAPIDAALSKSAQPHGAVMVVAVTNVRALMGKSFGNRLVSPIKPSAHNSPRLDAGHLSAAVQLLRPGAVVVPPGASPTFIGNWAPPGYTKVETISGSAVYVPPVGP